jgi:hypothetical protein
MASQGGDRPPEETRAAHPYSKRDRYASKACQNRHDGARKKTNVTSPKSGMSTAPE